MRKMAQLELNACRRCAYFGGDAHKQPGTILQRNGRDEVGVWLIDKPENVPATF